MALNPYESPRDFENDRRIVRNKPFLSDGGWWAIVILLFLFSIVVINTVQVELNRLQSLPAEKNHETVEDAQP